MRVLVIYRDEWLYGEGYRDSYLYREADGKKCCIGFDGLDRGVPLDMLRNKSTLAAVIAEEWRESWWFHSIYFGSCLLEELSDRRIQPVSILMAVNDQEGISQRARETVIADLFATYENTLVLFRDTRREIV